jgi:hypothetical protein
MTINAHPLTWPEGWKRTPEGGRRFGHFSKRVQRPGASYKSTQDITVSEAVQRVLAELTRWAIGRDDIVISTNVPVRLDGLPRSDAKRPLDPGAAVYWEESTGERRCIAVDQYTTVEDNLAAIAATLDAMRAIERHGGAEILQRAFTGFTALAAPAATRNWWDVLSVPKQSTPDAITAAYRRLRSEHHPDKGGSAARFDEVERAYREATS